MTIGDLPAFRYTSEVYTVWWLCRLEVRLGFSRWPWSFCFLVVVTHLACCHGSLHGMIDVVHLATHVQT